MRKIIVLASIVMFLVLCLNNKDFSKLPKEMIRYRIIANSNSESDQKEKWEINQEVIPILANIEQNASSIDETRYYLSSNIPKIKNILNKYSINSDVNYGFNYFPQKEYNGFVMDEGQYESLVITLGDGLGDNWWCILFPPLCLLEATYDNKNEIKYDYYFKKIINKYV